MILAAADLSSQLFRPFDALYNSGSSNVPPALPPKKNRISQQDYQRRQQQQQQFSKRERIIPIVRESDGSVVAPRLRGEYSGCGGSGGVPLSKRFSTESAGTNSASNSSVYSAEAEAEAEGSEEGRPDSIGSSGNDSAAPFRPGNFRSPVPSLPPGPAPPPPLIPPQSTSPTPPRTPSPVTSVDSGGGGPGGDGGRGRKKKSRRQQPSAEGKSAGSSSGSPDEVPEESALNKLLCEEEKEGKQWMRSLIYANNSEGILELRAGDMDELIVLATQTTNRDFVYQDAFLLTYRTFVTTMSLLRKLQHRFRAFADHRKEGQDQEEDGGDDPTRLRAARSAFSLMVRVVDSLIDCDLNSATVSSNLSSFISELVERGDLLLARALRTKFIQKYEEHRTKNLPELDFGRLALNRKNKFFFPFFWETHCSEN